MPANTTCNERYWCHFFGEDNGAWIERHYIRLHSPSWTEKLLNSASRHFRPRVAAAFNEMMEVWKMYDDMGLIKNNRLACKAELLQVVGGSADHLEIGSPVSVEEVEPKAVRSNPQSKTKKSPLNTAASDKVSKKNSKSASVVKTNGVNTIRLNFATPHATNGATKASRAPTRRAPSEKSKQPKRSPSGAQDGAETKKLKRVTPRDAAPAKRALNRPPAPRSSKQKKESEQEQDVDSSPGAREVNESRPGDVASNGDNETSMTKLDHSMGYEADYIGENGLEYLGPPEASSSSKTRRNPPRCRESNGVKKEITKRARFRRKSITVDPFGASRVKRKELSGRGVSRLFDESSSMSMEESDDDTKVSWDLISKSRQLMGLGSRRAMYIVIALLLSFQASEWVWR